MGVRCQLARAQTGRWGVAWGQGAMVFWTTALRAPSSAMTATRPPLAVVAMPQ